MKRVIDNREQFTENRAHGKKYILIMFFLYSALCALYSFAEPVTSTELITRAKELDGQTVTYQGEVIGDIMARGDYAWLNVLDKDNAVGVWSSKDFIKDIKYAGNYKTRGDIVEIVGIFHRSCKIHGGDFDIHAESVKIIKQGAKFREIKSRKKMTIMIFSGAVLGLSTLLKIYLDWKKRKRLLL